MTNSFLAAGGDGWFTFGTATAEGRTVDTFINYAQGFIDWLEQDAGGVASVPASRTSRPRASSRPDSENAARPPSHSAAAVEQEVRDPAADDIVVGVVGRDA
ncbi:MAG: hypothetical protein R2697_22360 [Ilumatobacteraceae bacterium]